MVSGDPYVVQTSCDVERDWLHWRQDWQSGGNEGRPMNQMVGREVVSAETACLSVCAG